MYTYVESDIKTKCHTTALGDTPVEKGNINVYSFVCPLNIRSNLCISESFNLNNLSWKYTLVLGKHE